MLSTGAGFYRAVERWGRRTASVAAVGLVEALRVGNAMPCPQGAHTVERLRREKGFEWLQACGELSIGQLDDPVKLNQALSRVAFDLLVYLHARAEELRREDEIDAVLELHSSDQALVGRSTRGCGLVHCEAGRAILSRAATLVREGLK